MIVSDIGNLKRKNHSGKFYAPFYRLFYCAYLYYFYALLKAYFRRKNALVRNAQGQIFVLFICVYNEPLKQIEYELSVFFKAYIVVWFLYKVLHGKKIYLWAVCWVGSIIVSIVGNGKILSPI